tara:strand:+ start:1114 stop:2367 length:1254 start_codon:yes stop_codon:yes gene_type:complete
MNKDLKYHLDNYIEDPKNPDNNFWLGWEYEKIGQYASAHTYYLRCAELTTCMDLACECIIKTWSTIEKQTRRPFYESQQLLLAVAEFPTRPEPYYFLSKAASDKEDWKEAYAWASIALANCNFNSPAFRTSVGYPGNFAIKYQKAYCSWYTGKMEDSKQLWIELYNDETLTPEYRQIVINNLLNWDILKFIHEPAIHTKNLNHNLRFPFINKEVIEKSYSQAMQDMFVLTVLNGKTNGTYLEIGSGDPFIGSNTALLETKFNWNGLSMDWNDKCVNDFNQFRNNRCIKKNTLLTNFHDVLGQFNMPTHMDYLSLDCDPQSTTYETLLRIPLDKYSFSVITYEHDLYNDPTRSYKYKAKEHLESYGYILVTNNIAASPGHPFEDWYMHKDSFTQEEIDRIKNLSINRSEISCKEIIYK